MDPELMAQLWAFLQSSPQTVSSQAKQTNYQQDQLQSLQNPMLAALMGGGRGFDPAAFDPVQVGQDTFDVPADPLAPYLQLPDGSEEKTIASGIANGRSPEQIVQDFAFTNPDDAKRVRATANDLFKERSKYQTAIQSVPGFDPSTGQWSVPDGGQYVGGKLILPKLGPSELTQTFEKYGIPTPNTQFSAQSLGYDPSQQSTVEGLAQQVQGLQGAAGESKKTWQEAQSMDRNNAAKFAEMRKMGAVGSGGGGGSSTSYGSAPGNPGDALYAQELQDAAFRQGKDQKYAGKDPNGMPSAQALAYGRYTKDITAQRKSERELVKQNRINDASLNAKRRVAENLSNMGLSPTTLVLLQRAQQLRQLGG